MRLHHQNYLEYMLPANWCAEETMDNLLMFNPNGNGAMTTSFFSILTGKNSIETQMSILAKNFIKQNNIELHTPLRICNRDEKIILFGTGTTCDGWFIKIWIVAQYPRIVFTTYQCECENDEIKICDSIIDSFKFKL